MSEATDSPNISDLLWEQRKFPPSAAFQANALLSEAHLYDAAREDYEAFWATQATETVTWNKPWNTICEWKSPYSKWFIGGELNVAYNCLDRHLPGRGDETAIIWEGDEPTQSGGLTYRELHAEVCRMSAQTSY